MSLFATKPISRIIAEAEETGEHTLKKALSAFDLTALGIGAIIGTGIFVLTGQAAGKHAGPAVVISMILAGIVSAFAASAIPNLRRRSRSRVLHMLMATARSVSLWPGSLAGT